MSHTGEKSGPDAGENDLSSGHQTHQRGLSTRPRRSLFAPQTRALHDAIDRRMQATGIAHLSPDGPATQTDLFGGSTMQQWQTRKAAFAMLGSGSWSSIEQVYSRYGSEAGRHLIEKLIELEQAAGVVLTDSGMQATALLFDALLSPGQHVLVGEQVYNKARTYLEWLGQRQNIEVEILPQVTAGALRDKVTENTRLVFCETFTNPLMRALHPQALSQAIEELRRDRAGPLRLVIDHTIATPWAMKRPLLSYPGIDAVVLSGTKALSGHDRDMFGYVASSRVGLLNMVMDLQAMRGGGLSWRVAEEVTATLPQAKDLFHRRCASAVDIAAFLQGHAAVSEVWHPSLATHPDHDLVATQYTLAGSLLSFRVAQLSEDEVGHFCDVVATTEVVRYALSFDGLTSKINHHRMVSEFHTPEPVLRKRNLDRLVRLGVGVEAPADIIACLDWALNNFRDISREAVSQWQAERRRALRLPPGEPGARASVSNSHGVADK